MAQTATRLLNLILLLQQEPNQSAARLAEALDVSVRTVQRYITMLEDMGVPIYAERGSHGGYSLVRGYRMPPLMFSPDEAVAVYLGTNLLEKVWGRLFRNAAASAMTKIENVLPREQLREVAWARSSLSTEGIPRSHPSLDMNTLSSLYQAARQSQQVEIEYQARLQQRITRRRLDPYGLVYSWGHQYCVGYCHLRHAIRSFRVDRIHSLKMTGTSFGKPRNFNPADHLSDPALSLPRREVRLYFPAESALFARDYGPYWDSFEEAPDGSVITSFFSPDMETATRRVLCFGSHARVIAPVELREMVQELALAIAGLYGPSPAQENPLAALNEVPEEQQ